MNMQALLKQAQKMQKELAKAESELKEHTYESTMAGGMVKVVVQGTMEVTKIEIDEELLNKDEKDTLQELLVGAMNDAMKQATDEKNKVMNKMTGGVKLPGGF